MDDFMDVKKLHEAGSCGGRAILRGKKLKTDLGVETITCPVCSPPITNADYNIEFFRDKIELVLRVGDQEVVLSSSKAKNAEAFKDLTPCFGVPVELEVLQAVASEISWPLLLRFGAEPGTPETEKIYKPFTDAVRRALGLLYIIFGKRIERSKR